MKKWIATVLCAVLLMGCAAWAENADPDQRARDVYAALLEGKFAEVTALFDENMADQVTEQALEQGFASVAAMLGSFGEIAGVETDDVGVTVLTANYERGSVEMKIVLDQDGRIAGLGLSPAVADAGGDAALPEGAAAQAVTLFAGTDRELPGEIVLPKGADASTKWVVLVHGSGASDMDETVGALKPFRDLAYGLAEKGVATLRFDKMTFAHPELPVDTVEAEYLQPAKEAARLLREEIGAQSVYLLGHSQGAMLAPYLVTECGFDGAIAMAGMPLPMWEMSYEQNLLMIDAMAEDQREALIAQVEAEAERARAIDKGALEDAKGQTIFGMDAYYLRFMDGLDEISLARDSGKPFLFLWGEADFQVSRTAFEAWEAGLGESEMYAYITYPGLNHLFAQAQEGDSIQNAMAAYSRAGNVDAAVIADIADWLFAR